MGQAPISKSMAPDPARMLGDFFNKQAVRIPRSRALGADALIHES